MANTMLGFPNRVDDATLSGGSWQATLPLNNLKDRVLGKVARSTDATTASTKFDMDLTAERNVRVISLVNHNMSLDATIRIYGADEATFASPNYDSGDIDVWPVVYLPDELEWEDDNWWSGKYTTEQREGYTWTFIHILSANTPNRYWRITINDTTNTDGYIDIGRVFIGPVWQPSLNFRYGAQIGWNTDTSVQKARSGALYFDQRTPRRKVQFSIDYLTDSEGMGNAFEIQRRAGIDQEVLYIFNPDDTVSALRRQFLGRLGEISPIFYPTKDKDSVSFMIEELL